jgi:hypothetical protein
MSVTPVTPHWRRARHVSVAMAAGLVVATLPLLSVPAHASSPTFTPGDVVVYRVGNGGSLSSSAAPVFLDEYTPAGTLVQSVALPTAASGANKPLVASGSAASEGELTLSADGDYLMAAGYDTSVGTAGVSGSAAATIPRTVARVDANGAVDTSTALTDFADGNNPRSATSSDGTHIWVGGAAGGVRATTLGATTSTAVTSSTDKNVRQVSIFDGQLYASADPTKAGVTIGTVGSGLPTSGSPNVANLNFSSAPDEPYAYSLLTLGSGTGPDTLYVADNSASAIEKYNLIGGSWTAEGTIPVPDVTGLTANDDDGTVVLFATSSGSSGEQGTLYEATDTSGIGGTLSGSADVLASSGSEAFRGVAFTPGTTVGSGGGGTSGGGGSGGPTITTADTVLAASIGDPTNPSLGVTVGDPSFAPSQLTVSATSSNQSVAPNSGLQISGGDADRFLTVTPAGVGDATITLTATAPDKTTATRTISYAASANDGDPSDRYYAGAGNGSTEIDVGDGYMIVGDDLSNVLRLYKESQSGIPVKTFDFTGDMPFGAATVDIESAAESNGVIYWLGSLSNSDSGNSRPSTDTLFATQVTGSGADTSLTYLGSDTHLREDLIAWDAGEGDPLGLTASASGDSKTTSGLNVEGLEFASGSSTTAYLAFRAPLEPPTARADALLVPVTNLTSLTQGNPGSVQATFGTPLEWDLGGNGIREIRKNADNQYLVISGSSDGSDSSFGLYTWDGDPQDQPVATTTALPPVEDGAWEGIVSVPDPLTDGASVELVEDNGDTVWYGDGFTSKNGLAPDLQKDLGRTFTLSGIGPPAATPEAPVALSLPLIGLAGVAIVAGLTYRRRRTAP